METWEDLFVCVESIVTAVVDLFPNTFRKKNRRELLILFLSIFSYLIGLVMLTEGGVYVFQLFDYYAASGMCLLFVAIFETICIGWVYGADKFYDDIEHMIGYRPLLLIKYCWQFVTPAVCARWHQLTSSEVELPQRLPDPKNIFSDPSPSEAVHLAPAEHESNC
ncbi:hypothetical protein NDU88_006406 [Pleurodeles waltl]|uniref:Uncharacterized protein n=1 Tax=Pleurodeles waltl TaxID=8319 RepID=A0AAV7SPK5_PLEWA|nr:hypothetical protein NDU88_006406 [Pleurodeles waltl]